MITQPDQERGGEPAIVGRCVLLDGVPTALDLDGLAKRDDVVGGRFLVRSLVRRPDVLEPGGGRKPPDSAGLILFSAACSPSVKIRGRRR